MSAEVIRRRIVVYGHVQGVFFRDSVRRRAVETHLAGWVCNRPDGAVEAVLEGAPNAVERLVRFCETGPRHAEVARVDVAEEQPEGLGGFEVR